MDEKQQRIEVGKRLRELRENHLKLNQKRMSELVGYAQSGYSRLEKGDFFPNIEAYNALYTKRFVNVKWLMTGEGEVFLGDSERTALAVQLSEKEADEMTLFEFERQLKGKPTKENTKTDLLKSLKLIELQIEVLRKQIEDL